jgi:glyoxylase-like metal-dependent hydrolase (beta-lactamase superfamily II)
MQVTHHIHALEIPFRIPLAPGKSMARSVHLYLVLGARITLIDSGVAGAHQVVFDYLRAIGRGPEEIATLILTHAHPDHIGSARSIRRLTGCRVLAHALEKEWIEDTDRQKHVRPVPGFDVLVEGPVRVDAPLTDRQILDLDAETSCQVYATPGHSAGSLSLLFARDKVLVSGDALPLPGDLPIYDDLAGVLRSIATVRDLAQQAETLLSSWEAPIRGQENIRQRIVGGVSWLRRIHATVLRVSKEQQLTDMELCAGVVQELGLPPFAANPLVARSLLSSLAVAEEPALFARWEEA